MYVCVTTRSVIIVGERVALLMRNKYVAHDGGRVARRRVISSGERKKRICTIFMTLPASVSVGDLKHTVKSLYRHSLSGSPSG